MGRAVKSVASATRGRNETRMLPRRKRPLRSLALMAAMVAGFWAPASAQPVLCATVTYQILGGPQQPVVDDCWISSNWDPQGGLGPDCDGPNDILDVCYEVSISHPMP